MTAKKKKDRSGKPPKTSGRRARWLKALLVFGTVIVFLSGGIFVYLAVQVDKRFGANPLPRPLAFPFRRHADARKAALSAFKDR
jgi:hypothetical protein